MKVKNTLKNQASLLEEDSKELFGKSFRKHTVATTKAKKESKEVCRKTRVNGSDRRPFRKSPSLQKQNWGRLTTPKFSRGQSTSSSQPSQGSQPPWKSKDHLARVSSTKKETFLKITHLYQKHIFRIFYQCIS